MQQWPLYRQNRFPYHEENYHPHCQFVNVDVVHNMSG